MSMPPRNYPNYPYQEQTQNYPQHPQIRMVRGSSLDKEKLSISDTIAIRELKKKYYLAMGGVAIGIFGYILYFYAVFIRGVPNNMGSLVGLSSFFSMCSGYAVTCKYEIWQLENKKRDTQSIYRYQDPAVQKSLYSENYQPIMPSYYNQPQQIPYQQPSNQPYYQNPQPYSQPSQPQFVQCPQCKFSIQVPSLQKGMPIQCPNCGLSGTL